MADNSLKGRPTLLDEEPERFPHLAWVWAAWHELQTDRDFVGMGASPMPLSFGAVDRYARRYGLDDEAFRLLRAHLRALDNVWLDHETARRKREQDKGSRSRGDSKPPRMPPRVRPRPRLGRRGGRR